MKNIFIALTVVLSSAIASAEGISFLPILDADYQMKPIVSLKVGNISPANDVYKSTTVTGVELALDCPLIKITGSGIRQQVSYNTSTNSTTSSKLNTLELNPHYIIPVMENMSVGVGPGFGLMMLSSPGYSKNIATLQLGGGLNYDINQIHLGAEVRYQYTEQVGFTSGRGLNNTMTSLKIGYIF